jgi:WD40 repeat protein
MRYLYLLLAAVGLAFTAESTGQAGEPSKNSEAERITGLIRQLGDKQFVKREAASKGLEAIGVSALHLVRRASLSHPDLEIRRRARQLVQRLATKLQLRRLEGHTDGVITVALSPDGKLAMSGPVCYTSTDSAARLWDLETGKELRRLEGHKGGVYCAAFFSDGKRAVTGGDLTLRVWDVASGKEVRRLEGHTKGVYGLALAADDKSLLSADADGTLRLWDVASGKEVRQFRGHAAPARAVAVSPDGKRAASVGVFADQTLRVWDVATAREVHRINMALAAWRDTWGTATVTFSPDGKLVAAANSQTPLVRLWEAATGKNVLTLRGHVDVVGTLAFTPDGQRLLSGGEDRTIRVWDLCSGEELYSLPGHEHRIWGIAVAPDGRRALSASFDRTIRVWSLR